MKIHCAKCIVPLADVPIDGPERDQRFLQENNRIWGRGNWMKCYDCPPDHFGNPIYHHINHHEEKTDGNRDHQRVL
jgi:hypothetical protein